jgi:hypothetical protein
MKTTDPVIEGIDAGIAELGASDGVTVGMALGAKVMYLTSVIDVYSSPRSASIIFSACCKGTSISSTFTITFTSTKILSSEVISDTIIPDPEVTS